jgi:CheY-like chemotaxis protein
LTRLVDDLLDVSRVSRGKIQLQKENFDLTVAVHQAVESCRPLIDARRHHLNLAIPSEPVYIDGDLARLSQVVANLLNNAAKYTDEGGAIGLTLESCREAGEAMIRVTDNGRGIAPAEMEHLFELFYQADHNLDRSDGGLGIGLSLVRSLVNMHHGRVEVRSDGAGRGSEFTIWLPCSRQAPHEQAAPPQAAQHVTDGMKLLVVDDNRDSAKSMGILLNLLGYQVTLAHDGREAVNTALKQKPDAILLDIGLPELNGYQACRQMREGGLTRQLIIAMTGYGQEEDRKLSQEAGFDHHLVKPVSMPALEALLSRRAALK